MVSAMVSAGLSTSGAAQERFIVVASTTSTENSGLFGHILPMFERATGIRVRVVAVGTGQALRLARAGDADVLLVHHRASEEAFVADGFGVGRQDVMFNDFVLVGPAADPAGAAGTPSITAALKAIAAGGAAAGAAGGGVVFVSRGDDSGTHKKEQDLWRAAGLTPDGPWYREVGAGMGAALNMATQSAAYTLSDRATWASFGNKGEHAIVAQGDDALFNPYGVILVNPQRHPHIKAADGQALIDWLVSDAGQTAIASFRVDGEQLFYPNAHSPNVRRPGAEGGS